VLEVQLINALIVSLIIYSSKELVFLQQIVQMDFLIKGESVYNVKLPVKLVEMEIVYLNQTHVPIAYLELIRETYGNHLLLEIDHAGQLLTLIMLFK